MFNPFTLPPHPAAQQAAKEVIEKVHAYMRMHPESELHRQGKMFGVLVYNDGYLTAFSAKLDGSYYHEGFVPPVWDKGEGLAISRERMEPVGHSKEESQRLQRLLFAQYHLLNSQGESKNLLEIFQNEKPIISAEQWFSGNKFRDESLEFRETLPPSGAGECCAPKLLQYAFTHGLEPVSLAEFWVGAPSKTDVRTEGAFYAPCSGRCVPILRHMLKGLTSERINELTSERINELAKERVPEVLYEDKWLMVANKPAGLLSVPGKGEELCAESYLRLQIADCRFLKAAHRLDQDTSGLLVLAKTAEVYKELQAYFQRRDILKRYEAVLRPNDEMSRLRLNDGMVELPLLPNPYDRPRQMVNWEHGKVAITKYVVRERRADGTVLVDFYPLTGRTHQLRVHAAHPEGLNAPIVGDRLYNGEWLMVNGERNRLMLHAAEIRFVHPITKKEMHFCIPSNF